MNGSWTADMLELYPMDSNAMVHDLDAERFGRLLAYVEETAHDVKIAELVAQVSRRHPKYLRVKELFETFEAYRRIGQDIYEQWRDGHVRGIYDLCAGHGLLGLLLANRFPKLPVVCVDIERPPAFGHYVAVAGRLGIALDALRYVESDIAAVSLGPGSYVVSVHACNELTRTALTTAAHERAHFAVMPCCIRDGIYFRRIKHVDDRVRYAAAAGFIAGRFGAEKITAIDERITNRNLILLGGGGNGRDDDADLPSGIDPDALRGRALAGVPGPGGPGESFVVETERFNAADGPVEVAAGVRLRVQRSAGWHVDWPVIETDEEIMVFSSYSSAYIRRPVLRYVDVVRRAYRSMADLVAARVGGGFEQARATNVWDVVFRRQRGRG